MAPLKPFKTYSEQIEHLKSAHGLIVRNEDQAGLLLSRANYYRLSAYGLSLRDPSNRERYRPGTTFEELYGLYAFDGILRTYLFMAIEEIEVQFRTKVAYQLGKEYGPEGYVDPSNFSISTQRQARHADFLRKLRNEISRQENLPCVAHHNEKYGGHFPIWAAVELLTFGNIITLFSVMKSTDRKAIADEYGIAPKHLASWMLALVEVRNICAHSGRIYNMPLKQHPYLFKEYAAYKQTNKLFPVVLVIKFILDGQPYWDTFASAVNRLFRNSRYVDLQCLGFPDNWKNVLDIPD